MDSNNNLNCILYLFQRLLGPLEEVRLVAKRVSAFFLLRSPWSSYYFQLCMLLVRIRVRLRVRLRTVSTYLCQPIDIGLIV